MRTRVALVAILVLAPVAAATHPLSIVLSDWASGEWLVGTPLALVEPLSEINEARFPIDVPECHRAILLDVLFSPNATSADVEGVGSVSVLHEVEATLWNGSERIASVEIRHEGYGMFVGLAPTEGQYELRARLGVGADVDWSARVRGRLLEDEPGCSHPLD